MSVLFLIRIVGLTDSISDTFDLLNLSLEELSNIQVTTPSRHEEEASKAPASIYVITEKEMIENGYFSLLDVLENIPGVTPINLDYFTFGGQRGMLSNFSQTLILIDGREVQNLIAAETFISKQFSTGNIKQVEVIQGPGSALYGANALAGVINIITKSGQQDFEGTEVLLDIGSQNTESINVLFGKNQGDFRMSGNIMVYNSDMWDFTEDISDTVHFKNQYEMPDIENGLKYSNTTKAMPCQFQISFKNYYLGYYGYFLKSRGGIENISLDYASQYDERSLKLYYSGFSKKFSDFWNINGELRFYKERINVVNFIFYPDIYQEMLNSGRNPDIPINDEEILDSFLESVSQEIGDGSTRINGFIQLRHQRGKHTNSVFSYELNQNYINNLNIIDSRLIGFPTEERDQKLSKYSKQYKHSFYFQHQTSFFSDLFRLTLGGRCDYFEYYENIFTFRGGLIYLPDPLTRIKLLYGEGFREPNIFEQGAFVSDYNHLLKPAKMKTLELSFSRNFFHLMNLNTVFFHQTLHNSITANDTYFFYNDKNIKIIKGIESSLTLLLDKIKYRLGYSYIDPEKQIVNDVIYNVLGVYQHSGFTGLTYKVSNFFNINMKWVYWKKTKALHGNPHVKEVISVPAFSRLDLTLSAIQLCFGDIRFNLNLNLRNLFNQKNYQFNPRRGGPMMFPQPGRQWLIRFSCYY